MRGKVYITFSREKSTVPYPLKVRVQRQLMWRNADVESKDLPDRNSLTNKKTGYTRVHRVKNLGLTY